MTEHIQINDTAPRIQYLADGVMTNFTYPFPIFKDADLEVWLDQTKQASGYAVSGAGQTGGGTVSMNAPPSAGTLVTLRRRLSITRTTDYQTDGLIRAKTLNDEFDFQTAALQQLAEDLAASPRRAPFSPSAADLTLPEPQPDRTLKWSADGLSLVNSAHDPDAGGDATTAAAAAIAAAETAVAAAAQAQAASSAMGDPLNRGLNLADLPDAAAARGHLDVYSKAEADSAASAAFPSGFMDRMLLLERNLALNTLRDQIDAGWSVLHMADGIADEFEDNAGIQAPSVTAATRLLIKGEGANGGTVFTDAGPNGSTIAASGVVTSTAQAKFGTSSMYFGTHAQESILTVSHHPDYNLTGDFTIDWWQNVSDYVTEANGICRKFGSYGTTDGYALFVQSNGLHFYCNGGGGCSFLGASEFIRANQWQHLALVRKGASFRAYVDGNDCGLPSFIGGFNGNSVIAPNTAGLQIGSAASYTSGWYSGNTAAFDFAGYMDDFRISNIALWETSFTPPTKSAGVATADLPLTVWHNANDNYLLMNGNCIRGIAPTANFSWSYGSYSTNHSKAVTDGLPGSYAQASGDNSANAGIRFDCGPGAAHKPNRFRQYHDGAQSTCGDFALYGSNTGSFAGEEIAIAAGAYVNSIGWQEHSFAPPVDGYRYFEIRSTTPLNAGNPSNRPLVFEMELIDSLPTAVCSEVFTAQQQPVEIRTILLLEALDEIELNTDFIIEASIDGGANWALGAAADDGAFDQTAKIVSAVADVSAQTGVSVMWRATVDNGKRVRLHGVWLQWR